MFALHDNSIAHLDVKDTNILVFIENNITYFEISDFNSAMIISDDCITDY